MKARVGIPITIAGLVLGYFIIALKMFYPYHRITVLILSAGLGVVLFLTLRTKWLQLKIKKESLAKRVIAFIPYFIILKTLLGQEEELISSDSIIWKCTNCYSCYERCPQDVRPVEVIIALKNYCNQKGIAPELIDKYSTVVATTGRSIAITDSINKRRAQLGLKEIKEIPVDELRKIIEM